MSYRSIHNVNIEIILVPTYRYIRCPDILFPSSSLTRLTRQSKSILSHRILWSSSYQVCASTVDSVTLIWSTKLSLHSTTNRLHRKVEGQHLKDSSKVLHLERLKIRHRERHLSNKGDPWTNELVNGRQSLQFFFFSSLYILILIIKIITVHQISPQLLKFHHTSNHLFVTSTPPATIIPIINAKDGDTN